MILFEKSIVIAATFLLIVLFIGYLGIKVKDGKRIEGMQGEGVQGNSCTECASSLNNAMYQQLKQEQTAFQNKITAQLKKMQKSINANTLGVADYKKNRDEFSKAMVPLS